MPIKHGLLAREAVIVGEDPAEFEMYREGMLADAGPGRAGGGDAGRAGRGALLAAAAGRTAPEHAFAALDEGEPTELLEARLEEWKQHKGSERDRTVCGVLDENAALGKAVVEDFAEARVLDRMLMYERRIESSLYRTMAELRREREARAAASDIGRSLTFEGHPPAGQEPATPAELASFGVNHGRRRHRVGNISVQATALTSHFKLHTSHFQLLEEKITPYGVTTNAPGRHSSPVPDVAAEEPSCETNPISEGRPAWLGRQTPEGEGQGPHGNGQYAGTDERYF